MELPVLHAVSQNQDQFFLLLTPIPIIGMRLCVVCIYILILLLQSGGDGDLQFFLLALQSEYPAEYSGKCSFAYYFTLQVDSEIA